MDLVFAYKDTAQIAHKTLMQAAKPLKQEFLHMNKAALDRYDDDRASIHAPFDKYALAAVERLVAQKKKCKPSLLVVVGIGGSNLGTIAVQEAILSKLHNDLDPALEVLYADTTDPTLLMYIQKRMEQLLKKGKNVIINAISKSGGTTETIANFEVLLETLKKYKKNHEDYVVVTTGQDSNYHNLAVDKKYATLEIPSKVGGRYSVFTPVGLFPLGMLGIDIKKLLKGARTMRARCLKTKWQDNPAATSALLRYCHSKKGKNINDMFLFKPDLESVGKWYRQLMGESIGKEFNRKKKRVFNGITPTVSVGSTDLHSMAQLYLGGPYDKYTLFVSSSKKHKLKIPKHKEYDKLVPDIQGRPVDDVMHAILDGVKKAYAKGKRPYAEIILSEVTETTMGQLLQFFMMEMMYLGALMGVNPFDQPNVEAYKIETKKILARKQ